MEDIFEQVDEQLDTERVQKLWEKNRKWIVGGLILLFFVLFVYVGWQDYQVSRSQSASQQFMAAQELLDQKDIERGQAQLHVLLDEYSGHGYALFGRFLQAKSLADSGKREAAVAQLDQLAKEAPSPLRGLALLNAAYLTSGDAERCGGFLARMDKNAPYQAHALELQGILATQKGDGQRALTLYRQAHALTTEGTLRGRLENRLERLGGEEKK